MKFPLFKIRKKSLPALSSLRPPIFDVYSSWFGALGLFAVVVIVTALIGMRLFYSVYSESYKKETSTEEAESLINSEGLKKAVRDRDQFISATTTLPADPAI